MEDLELFLGKIENKLFELTSEYKKEKKELKNTITKLKNSLKQKEQSFNELKKLHKLNVEDLDKRKNRVNKLKRHIAGLPTTEESNRLKTEVHLLRNERDCLVTEMSENKNKLELEIISITEKEAQILSLNKDVHRQHKAIDNLQQKLLKSGKSQENLRALERVELQVRAFICLPILQRIFLGLLMSQSSSLSLCGCYWTSMNSLIVTNLYRLQNKPVQIVTNSDPRCQLIPAISSQ